MRADRPWSIGLRAFLVARSRYAEDSLTAAVERGTKQYVVLGAGLDTFAYRSPWPSLRVFEVDHPATQEWKRGLLAGSGIALPPSLSYVPVDFEKQYLADELAAAGFDQELPAFFSWLGVVPYLSLPAFRAMVLLLAGLAPGSGLVLDYGQPRAALPPQEQLAHDSLASRVELSGEPFQLFFTPQEMAAELARFQTIEDLGRDQINARYFAGRQDELRMQGQAGRMVSAWL